MNTAGHNNRKPQIVHTTGQTNIAWEAEPTSGFTDTVYWNYVTDGGAVGAPVLVSTGTGCAFNAGNYNQSNPSITRSQGGTWSYVAWTGFDSVEPDVYVRRVTNSSGALTDCASISDANSGPGGDNTDVSISTNSDNRTFVAWQNYDGATDYDVFLASVKDDLSTVCEKQAVFGVDDYNPEVAAGDVVSDWVHLVWEHGSPPDEIQYNLYDASNCLTSPFSVNTGGDAGGYITLTTSAGTDGDHPIIAVRTQTDILDTLQQNTYNPETLSPQTVQNAVTRLVGNGALSKAEADALLADGQVTTTELQAVMSQHIARAEARMAADRLKTDNVVGVNGPDQPSPRNPLDTNQPADGLSTNVPDAPNADALGLAAYCATAAPDDQECQAAARSPQSISATSAVACGGINAQDAVVVAWLDDVTDDDVWAIEMGAGSYSSFSCIKGYLDDNGPIKLTRYYDALDDDAPTRVLVTDAGVGHVVYSGLVNHTILVGDLDYDIFYTVTHIPVYLPLTLKNYP